MGAKNQWRRAMVLPALAAAIVVVSVAGSGAAVAQQPPSPRSSGGPGVPAATLTQAPVLSTHVDEAGLGKPNKIAAVLDKLYRVDLLGRVTANRPVTAANIGAIGGDIAGLTTARRLRLAGNSNVQVWVETGADVPAAVRDLTPLGAQIEQTDAVHHIIQAAVPIAQLQAIAQLASVATVRLPDYGIVQSGSQLTQGDSILGASALRAQLGVLGGGVTVGVISDGMQGLTTSQGSGDLGAVDTTTCNETPAKSDPTGAGAGAEGTAMAEIVHDIAPGAAIMYGYFGDHVSGAGTALDFNNAVNCLAQHADVVVDDIGWIDVGSYDGTSLVSANTTAALNNPVNRIRGYYTAAGNQAQFHYRDPYLSSGVTATIGANSWVLQKFAATSETTDGGFGLNCGAGVSCGDTIEVEPNSTFSVFLEWNEPFGSATSDYDLLVQDNSTNPGVVKAESTNRQGAGFHDPVEEFSLTNTNATPTVYNIIIGNYKGLAPARTFNMFIDCPGCLGFPTGQPAPDDIAGHNFNTTGHSMLNESDAGGGVLSVAAIDAADSPAFDTIEGYSSRGPTDALTNSNKPDIAGIDCVHVTGDGGFATNFCGTSAAAPHVAAIAALLLSCNPRLLSGGSVATATARTTLKNALLNGAVDLGAAGVDTTFGAGRVSVAGSNPLANCDTDNDGARDVCETTLGLSPTNPWDFYSVPVPALFAAPDPTTDFRDSIVSASDAQAVFGYFRAGAAAGEILYEQDLNNNGIKDGLEYDRTILGPGQTGPPDGVLSASEAQAAFAQFRRGFAC